MSKEEVQEEYKLETVYNFNVGRNTYCIDLSDVKKVTLLQHNFKDTEDDKVKLKDSLFVLTITGYNKITVGDGESEDFENLIEIRGQEEDYKSLYNIYESFIIALDKFRKKQLRTERNKVE